jgi:hypothetical protein
LASRRQLEGIARDRIGRQAVDHRLHQAAELGHLLAELLVDLGVALARTWRSALGALGVAVAQQVAAVVEGREGLFERQHFVAVRGRSRSRMIHGRSSETTYEQQENL